MPATQAKEDQAAYSRDENARDKKQAEWEKQHSKLQLWFNGLVAFTALFGVLLGIYQIRESRLSSAENARDVAKSFRLAERSADTAERAVRAVESLAAAEGESVKRAQEATRLEQRAWVGLHFVTPRFEVGSFASADIIFTNGGRSPAIDFTATICATTLKGGTEYVPKATDCPPPKTIRSQSVMLPNANLTFKTPPVGRALDQETVTALNGGTIIFCVKGDFSYRTLGEKHGGTLCVCLNQDLKGMASCSTYNTDY